ncbi:hypothetical protein [Bacteroides sp. 51]|uniref:hypothetical protein n=1 Tax=Bacteroides sp. 51 TaxID=2302938 RepID=UPI0013D11858|nr:hypothetical protein [Bacteroides sp. 51]
MKDGQLNDKESAKTLLLLLLAILLIGYNEVTSSPALIGIGIITYLLINIISLLKADQKQKEYGRKQRTPAEHDSKGNC